MRRDPLQTPELIVFLIESFLDNDRYQKAIAAADLLLLSKGELGDRARYLKLVAMWRQNPRAELLDSFLLRAVEIAPQIERRGSCNARPLRSSDRRTVCAVSGRRP